MVQPTCEIPKAPLTRVEGGAGPVGDIGPIGHDPGAGVGEGNPKDFVGASKAPLSTVYWPAIHELGLAMLEGECKYWRHNYLAAPVRATVYFDAFMRHISAWMLGQDIDPASGLSHLSKAAACVHIVRAAQMHGALVDDRPPAAADVNWIDGMNEKAKALIEANSVYVRGAYIEANREQWSVMSAALAKGPIKKEGVK